MQVCLTVRAVCSVSCCVFGVGWKKAVIVLLAVVVVSGGGRHVPKCRRCVLRRLYAFFGTACLRWCGRSVCSRMEVWSGVSSGVVVVQPFLMRAVVAVSMPLAVAPRRWHSS